MPDLNTRVRLIGAREAQAEAAKTSRAIRKIGTSSKETSEEQKAAGGTLMGTMKGVVGLAAGAGVYEFFKSGVQGALSLNQQMTALNNQLGSVGIHSRSVTQQLKAQAEAASTSGGGTTEQELAGMTQLLGETHKLTVAQKAQAAANDLARAKGMSYSQALSYMTSLEAGRTRGLGQQLGVIIPNTAESDKLTTAYQTQLDAYKRSIEYVKGPGKATMLADWELTHRVLRQQSAQATAADKVRTAQQVLSEITAKYSNKQESTNQKIHDAEHAFQNLTANLATALLPTINKLIGVGVQVTEFLTKHKTLTQDLAIAIGFLATVIIAGKFIGALKSAAATLKLTSLASALFGTTSETAGEEAAGGAAAATAGWELFAASTIIGLLIPAVMLIVTHFSTVKRIATEVVRWVVKEFNGLVHVLAGVATSIGHFFSGMFNTIISPFKTAINWIKGHAQDLNPMHWISKGAGAIGGLFNSVFAHGGEAYKAAGGPIYRTIGGPSGTDTVPAWLSPGEYVVPAQAARSIGIGNLQNAISSGYAGGFGGGGEMRIVAEPTQIKLTDQAGRVIGQTVLKWVLDRNARGTGGLVGGSLATTGGYTALSTGGSAV